MDATLVIVIFSFLFVILWQMKDIGELRAKIERLKKNKLDEK